MEIGFDKQFRSKQWDGLSSGCAYVQRSIWKLWITRVLTSRSR